MTLPSTHDGWLQVLESLQQRNGSIEVTAIAELSQVVVPTYRVRLLRFDEQGLLIERPSGVGVGKYLSPGAPVSALAAVQGNRWEIMTQVLAQQWHALNPMTEVPALLLQYPQDVCSAQRRSFFRIGIHDQDVEPALLMPASFEGHVSRDDPQPPPRTFRARIVNASGGGLGVIAPQQVAEQLTEVARYHCRVQLPTLTQPMEMPVRVVHLQPQENGTYYMGLSLDDELRNCKTFAEELCKFSAWYQRRALQRLRERR